jgi:Alpha/beta hydrolase domain
MWRHRSWLAGLAFALTISLVGLPASLLQVPTAGAAAASPKVTGPITGGTGATTVFPASFPLSQVGYEESEYFLSGKATSYTSATALTSDGRWTATPATTASYTTRAVVRRPIDPSEFNGTVVVEWLNVTGGVDADPDWTMTHNELVRKGFAWVGVSAQLVGVNATKSADPVRYASLSHPGDSYSYDIFSQAGQAVRDDSALMLGGLKPKKVVGIGESQSAARLVTYINAVHPLVHVYDGFLVHSRFSTGTPLSQAPQTSVPAPAATTIRGDLDVPVLVFETETDVFSSNLADRQPDTKLFRLWEVAGTSHYDNYGLVVGPQDTGNGQGAIQNLAAMQDPPTSPPPGVFTCNLGINTGGAHWILDAAVYWLNRWVDKGIAPPIAPLLDVTGTSPVVFARDTNGNALGGVRSPQVDAPIATLTGTGNTGSGSLGQFCGIFGSTTPFSARKLASLYKNHGRFVSQWDQAAQRDVKGGFLVQHDANELKHSANISTIGR